MEKIALAARVSSTDITEEKPGCLRIASNKTDGYLVMFNREGMPCCSCYDWKENFLPCKHMFAVILHSNNYTWESLPSDYRDSPYFTLDSRCSLKMDNSKSKGISSGTEYGNAESETEVMDFADSKDNNEGSLKTLNLPTSFVRRSDGAACRDTLDQLKSLTFNIANKKTLEEMNDKLKAILQEAKNQIEKEDDLVLEADKKQSSLRKRSTPPSLVTTEKKKPKNEDQYPIYAALPQEKKRHNKDARVGIGAEKRRGMKSSFLDIATGLIGILNFQNLSVSKITSYKIKNWGTLRENP